MEIRSVPELLAWNPPNLPRVIGSGILHREERMLIFGKFGSWKSMFAMDLGFRLATATPWLGFETSKLNTLILQIEVSAPMYKERIHDYSKANNTTPNNLFIWTEANIKLDSSYGMAALDKAITQTQAEVVIIDPLYKVVAGDLNSFSDMTKFSDNMDILRMKHSCTFIVVHHKRKTRLDAESGTSIDMGAEDATGSNEINNWVDVSMGLRVRKDDGVNVELEARFDKPPRNSKIGYPKPIGVGVSRDRLVFTKIETPITITGLKDMKQDIINDITNINNLE